MIESQSTAPRYWVEADASGEPTLWRDTGDPAWPDNVTSKAVCDVQDDELWTGVVAHFTGGAVQ